MLSKRSKEPQHFTPCPTINTVWVQRCREFRSQPVLEPIRAPLFSCGFCCDLLFFSFSFFYTIHPLIRHTTPQLEQLPVASWLDGNTVSNFFSYKYLFVSTFLQLYFSGRDLHSTSDVCTLRFQKSWTSITKSDVAG